jgi:hypothetical protein
MSWGKCAVCGEMKENMTEHHSKELIGKKMVICRDCHTTIEQYYQAVKNILSKDAMSS